MNNALAYNSYALSDKGLRRTVNEDAFLIAEDAPLWAVADGMGGHNAGDKAANVLVETLRNYRPVDSLADALDTLQQLLRSANQTIYSTAHSTPQAITMGTTLVLLTLLGNNAIAMWAGDSRLYRLRGGEISQMTSDHSLVQEMVDRGELSPDEAKHHPSSNVVTRAIGVAETLRPEIIQSEAQPGDRYLLCSDGLHRYVDLDKLRSLLSEQDIVKCGQALINYSLSQGGRDNVTAILIDLYENKPLA